MLVENTKEKVEIAHYKQFPFSCGVFRRFLLLTRLVWERVDPGIYSTPRVFDSLRHNIDFKHSLTHYQMINFRLFQTDRVCRQQFEI